MNYIISKAKFRKTKHCQYISQKYIFFQESVAHTHSKEEIKRGTKIYGQECSQQRGLYTLFIIGKYWMQPKCLNNWGLIR